MPAQAGIQGEQAAASGYSAWIPAFAGMTQYSSTPQNHHDRLLERRRRLQISKMRHDLFHQQALRVRPPFVILRLVEGEHQ